MYSCTLSLTSVLEGVSCNATARQLYPRERPATHCIGGRVVTWAGLDGCGKSRPTLGFEHQTVQSIASRYTD